MPKTQAIANGSARGYGFALKPLSAGATYYVAYYNPDANNAISNNVWGSKLANTGEIFYHGNTGSFPTRNHSILISSSGSLTFNKTFNYAGQNVTSSASAIDSSGNLYVGCSVDNTSGLTWSINKINSSGTSVSLSGQNVGRYNVTADTIFFDSSGNTYLQGWSGQYPATANIGYLKFNSSMSVTASGILNYGGASVGPAGGNIDSSGNLYFSGYVYVSGQPRLLLAKITSSNVVSWAYTYNLGGSALSTGVTTLPIDSSGNIYVHSNAGSTGYITKINSSGTEVWTKTLSYGATYGASTIVLDPTGANLYIAAYVGPSGSEKNRVIKMDTSSGNVSFEREFTTSSGTNTPYFAVNVNSNSYAIVASATISSVTKTIFGKFPTDGTKTGTYSVGGISVVYGAPSVAMTVGSTSLTRYTTTPTMGSSGGSNATITPTAADATGSLSATTI